MSDKSIAVFMGEVRKLRDRFDINDFIQQLLELDEFNTIVGHILKNNDKFAKSIANRDQKKKKEEFKLSENEIKWKRFFEDHQFSNMEEQRNLSDMISLLTGLELNVFLKVGKKGKDSFPAHISIVPLNNLNGNGYKLGTPIFSLRAGLQFYTTQVKIGLNMSTDPSSFSMSKKDQVNYIIGCLLYRANSITEELSYKYLSDAPEDNDPEESIFDNIELE